MLNTRTQVRTYSENNTKAYHAEACIQTVENGKKQHLYIHGTAYGGKYFVLSLESIFEYMGNAKPSVDIKVIEECRTKADFRQSRYAKAYSIVDDLLDDLMA